MPCHSYIDYVGKGNLLHLGCARCNRDTITTAVSSTHAVPFVHDYIDKGHLVHQCRTNCNRNKIARTVSSTRAVPFVTLIILTMSSRASVCSVATDTKVRKPFRSSVVSLVRAVVSSKALSTSCLPRCPRVLDVRDQQRLNPIQDAGKRGQHGKYNSPVYHHRHGPL